MSKLYLTKILNFKSGIWEDKRQSGRIGKRVGCLEDMQILDLIFI